MMTTEEVLYADVKFKQPGRTERAINDGGPASQQLVGSNGESKAKSGGGCEPGRVAVGFLCVLLAAAVSAVGILCKDNMETKAELQATLDKQKNLTARLHHEDKRYQTLKDKYDAGVPGTRPLTSSCLENTSHGCLKCAAGWDLHGKKCYHFSTSALNWHESRTKCVQEGGDLVKIDSEEEQKFLHKTLQTKMQQAEDKFWIGLTDSKEESKWLWVDNSPLRLSFWMVREPDNWNGTNPDGEDCARMGEIGESSYSYNWFDKSCKDSHKRICEKDASAGVPTCT
ncbi:immune-related, lectin-like receptor 4 [Lampris incognitus]|uniref:immune-related, lectin-like receptor 4 n=1 Tax=Lampris incognitus TaxID=2546036 RepID=UPI0024B61093|nr:immune-related, lectin-like receptor 4 [Lampris incognitus]